MAGVVHATWVNNKRKPFDDPPVRRAMHLVLDRPVLMEVVKDVAPMMSAAPSRCPAMTLISTACLANGGALERAQEMAAHESPRATKLL